MAYASILGKLSELECKIQSMNGNASLSSTPYNIPDVSDLMNRLTTLEAAQEQTQQSSQTVLQRIVALESVQAQTQQQSQTTLQRVTALEPRFDAVESSILDMNNKVNNLEPVFLDKLTQIESGVIADLCTRVETLEHKLLETTD